MATDIRQQINQMPMTQFLLISAILGCGYYFMMFEGADKYKNQIRELKSQTESLNTDIAANKRVIQDTDKFRNEVNQISDQFQSALEYLPSKSRIQDILSMLYTEARLSGVKLTRLKPLEPKQTQFYEELQMEISLGGNYGEITSFLSRVSKLPRIINIREVKLAPESNNPNSAENTLKFEGKLVTYRYLEGK